MIQSSAAIVSFVIAIAIAISLSAPVATSHPRLTQVSWAADIAPIVQRRCAGCHVEGGFGPMPLTRYETARNWSRAISDHTIDGLMPPWPAAAGIGDFENDRSLSPIEIELFAAWAEGGAAAGTPVANHSLPHDTRSRRADVVRELTRATSQGAAVSRFEVPLEGNRERWLIAWEFQPRERSRVERAVLGVANGGRISAWLPPEGLIAFPAGVANRLAAASTLTIDVYYRKGARPPQPGGRLSLYYGAEPLHELRHTTLPCGPTTLDESLDVLTIAPLTNESGSTIEAIASRPDRSVEPLILIPRFVTWYVPDYRFRSAIRLPRGSRVDVRSNASQCSLALDYVPVR
jgi:hypothetical protein